MRFVELLKEELNIVSCGVMLALGFVFGMYVFSEPERECIEPGSLKACEELALSLDNEARQCQYKLNRYMESFSMCVDDLRDMLNSGTKEEK